MAKQAERENARGAETTAPKIPCGTSSLGVRLLGNPCKQDGDLRERAHVSEALLSPGRHMNINQHYAWQNITQLNVKYYYYSFIVL